MRSRPRLSVLLSDPQSLPLSLSVSLALSLSLPRAGGRARTHARTHATSRYLSLSLAFPLSVFRTFGSLSLLPNTSGEDLRAKCSTARHIRIASGSAASCFLAFCSSPLTPADSPSQSFRAQLKFLSRSNAGSLCEPVTFTVSAQVVRFFAQLLPVCVQSALGRPPRAVSQPIPPCCYHYYYYFYIYFYGVERLLLYTARG